MVSNARCRRMRWSSTPYAELKVRIHLSETTRPLRDSLKDQGFWRIPILSRVLFGILW